jgi:hypothetical protein
MASVVTWTCLTVRRTLPLLFNYSLTWKMEDLVPDYYTGTIVWHTGHRTQYSLVTLKSVTLRCSDGKSRCSDWICMLFAQIVWAHNFICRALQRGSLWVKALQLLHTQVLTQSDLCELYSDLASDADSQTIHISEVIHQLYITCICDYFHILMIVLPMGFMGNK